MKSHRDDGASPTTSGDLDDSLSVSPTLCAALDDIFQVG